MIAAPDAGPVIVIHAGAGSFGSDLREHEAQSRAVLEEALVNGQLLLERGDDAITVVRSVVMIMESFGLFNAAYGSVPCSDGSVQMSAALMRGSDRAAGAVAGLRRTKHPIIAANIVLKSDQVLMIGEEADGFAAYMGAEQRPNASFVTERQLGRLRESPNDSDRGTVGAVCLDARGVLAAGTSTGGVRGQPPGRVGDSPLIGAGTWADERVAVSCTGDGEAFIRAGTARHIATLMQRRTALKDACDAALADIADLGGRGGLIAIDSQGNVAMPLLTEVMPRGIWRAGHEAGVWVRQPGLP